MDDENLLGFRGLGGLLKQVKNYTDDVAIMSVGG
jgi:hypothetical protein